MKLLTAASLSLAIALSVVPTHPQDYAGDVEKVFSSIEKSGGANVWEAARELDSLGRGALEEIRGGLRRGNPYVRMAAARYLFVQEQHQEAVEALFRLAVDHEDGKVRRTAGSLLTTLLRGTRTLRLDRKSLVDEFSKAALAATDEGIQVHLWSAIYALNQSLQAKRKLERIWTSLEKSDRHEVRADCALALAEAGLFSTRGVLDHLRALAKDPSPEGQRAGVYLKLYELDSKLQKLIESRPQGESRYDFTLLKEILDLLHEHYHDPDRLQKEFPKMMENAAKAITATLDPYTMYLTEEEYKKMQEEDLEGIYGGIGARVSMRKDKNGIAWLTIEEPIFSGPAYRAGLRSNDRIIEIEGVSTANADLQDLVKRLRGKPNTPVRIKVAAVRFDKPKEFEIVREQIHLETVQWTILPGKVGYIKQTTFGPKEADLLRDALREFHESGCLGVILDLRGNTGGLLDTAIEVANLFLDRGRRIVTIRSMRPDTLEKSYRCTRPRETDLPTAVLVNGGSASASEIVAGALRDHKRARLVGTRTYGKGSVQRTMMLESTDRKAAVKITTSRWYLPGGESVEKDDPKDSGIEPHVVVNETEMDVFKERELERFRATGLLEKYVEEQFPNNRELFGKLAEWDGGDPNRYPGFPELLKQMDSRARPEETREFLRELLREYVRRRVQDDRKKEFPCDFQTDKQLQLAVKEVAREANIDLAKIEEFRSLAEENPSEEH